MKLFCNKVKKYFTDYTIYADSYYYSSDLSLLPTHTHTHTHTQSLVEQYGERDLLKKEEKQVGYTDNGSICSWKWKDSWDDMTFSTLHKDRRRWRLWRAKRTIFLTLLMFIIKTQRRQMWSNVDNIPNRREENRSLVQDDILPFDKYVHMQSTGLTSDLWVKMDAFQFRENLAERITVWHNPVLAVPWLSS